MLALLRETVAAYESSFAQPWTGEQFLDELDEHGNRKVKGLKEVKLTDVRVSRDFIGTPQCLIFRPEVTPRRGTRVGVVVPLKGWTSPNLEYVVEFY